MKVYSVHFETYYEDGDYSSDDVLFLSKKDAETCLKRAVFDEASDYNYSDDEIEERLVQEDDEFTFFTEGGDKKFSGKIVKREINGTDFSESYPAGKYADMASDSLRYVETWLEDIGKGLCSRRGGQDAWRSINGALEDLREAIRSVNGICKE